MKNLALIAGLLLSFSSHANKPVPSDKKVTYVAHNAKIIGWTAGHYGQKIEFTTAYTPGTQLAGFCESPSPFDKVTVLRTILQGMKSENSRVELRMVDQGDKVLCLIDANISIY